MLENDKATLDRYRELSVGEILRRARIKAGYEIVPIAHQLNIRPELLEALEKNDHARLPGRVYVVGFVRTYAEALGLDGDKVAYLLKAQSMGQEERRMPDFPKPISDRRLPGPVTIAVSIGAVVVLLIVWAVLARGGESKPDIPEPPSETQLEAVEP